MRCGCGRWRAPSDTEKLENERVAADSPGGDAAMKGMD